MKITRRRCKICHKWFLPHPRTYKNQQCCSNAECQKKRKTETDKNWWKRNPGYNKRRKATIQAWARAYPDYWQNYRREHPEYVRRYNKKRRDKYKKEKNRAKQVTIREISLEKLESIKEPKTDFRAKQVMIQRRQNVILDYLFGKESSAKQVHMVNHIYNEP